MNRKVLFVAHNSNIHGGANRSLLAIVDKFKHMDGYAPYVLLPHNEGDMNEYLRKESIPIIVYPYHTIVTKKCNSIAGMLRIFKVNINYLIDKHNANALAKILTSYNFKLIYTNTRVVYIGGIVSKILNIPHIMHCRELINENNLRTVFFAEKKMNYYCTKVVAISKIMKDKFVKIDGNKCVLIYNGLPRSKATHKQQFGIREIYNVLLAGTIIPAKGQLDAIDAIGILKQKSINNVMLHIAGSDPNKGKIDSYMKVLREKARQLGIEEKIKFYGEVKDMEELRRNMDIELICSICEPFGRVTVEAMQNGLVVIGANAGATPEIINHGENGFLYEVHNSIDLANKLCMIFDSHDMATEMINNGYKYTTDNFTEEKTKQAVFELVKSVLVDE